MSEIEWREPPTPTRGGPSPGKGRWYRALNALRDRPGQWAYVGAADRSVGALIKSGHLGGAKPGEFETTTRKREDGQCDIYARLIGGESA